jgi:hypothetical protein
MNKIILLVFLVLVAGNSYSQERNKNYFVQWTTWTLIQAIPSPVFFQDNNETDSRMQFGLRWHITPINYSFNTNKFISPVSFFVVNPLNRYGGSIEAIIQPEWSTSEYKYSELNRFQVGSGIRGYVPLIEEGEVLSISLAGKYKFRTDTKGTSQDTWSAEIGFYTFYGIIGLQFNYNLSSESKFDIGLSLKYY